MEVLLEPDGEGSRRYAMVRLMSPKARPEYLGPGMHFYLSDGDHEIAHGVVLAQGRKSIGPVRSMLPDRLFYVDVASNIIKVAKDSHFHDVDAGLMLWLMGEATKHIQSMEEPPQVVVFTMDLPDGMTLPCGLYGPTMGDEPVAEDQVYYRHRGFRTWKSRIRENALPREVGQATIIAGPHEGKRWVLYTVYGGSSAPREPGDTRGRSIKDLAEGEAFWSTHALVDPMADRLWRLGRDVRSIATNVDGALRDELIELVDERVK
jgi:hypothetical protein